VRFVNKLFVLGIGTLKHLVHVVGRGSQVVLIDVPIGGQGLGDYPSRVRRARLQRLLGSHLSLLGLLMLLQLLLLGITAWVANVEIFIGHC